MSSSAPVFLVFNKQVTLANERGDSGSKGRSAQEAELLQVVRVGDPSVCLVGFVVTLGPHLLGR